MIGGIHPVHFVLDNTPLDRDNAAPVKYPINLIAGGASGEAVMRAGIWWEEGA